MQATGQPQGDEEQEVACGDTDPEADRTEAGEVVAPPPPEDVDDVGNLYAALMSTSRAGECSVHAARMLQRCC